MAGSWSLCFALFIDIFSLLFFQPRFVANKKGAASCAFSACHFIACGQLFFFPGLAFLPAAAFAFLSHPLTNLAIAAPRLADNLLSASARLLALRTSAFNPLTCFFKALMLACMALTLALAAEPAADFLRLADFFGAAFAAVFFTAALRVAAFFVAGRLTFFFAADFFVAAFLPATFLTAVFFLTAAFLTAGLAAFFFTAGRLAAFFAAGLLVADFRADFAFGFEVAALSAVAIIRSPQFNCGCVCKKHSQLYITQQVFDTNAQTLSATCIIVARFKKSGDFFSTSGTRGITRFD